MEAAALGSGRRTPGGLGGGNWEVSGLVAPPWGRDRANRDFPSREEITQRQHDYSQILDEQAASKAQAKRRSAEHEARLEKETSRSLATRTHQWGAEASNPQMERAVFRELLATVAHKQSKEQEKKYIETQDFARWKDESERALAAHWHSERLRAQQEMSNLASTWKRAADEKRLRKEEERTRTLQAEREALGRIADGMAPHRRMRKAPKQLACGHVSQVQLRAQMVR